MRPRGRVWARGLFCTLLAGLLVYSDAQNSFLRVNQTLQQAQRRRRRGMVTEYHRQMAAGLVDLTTMPRCANAKP